MAMIQGARMPTLEAQLREPDHVLRGRLVAVVGDETAERLWCDLQPPFRNYRADRAAASAPKVADVDAMRKKIRAATRTLVEEGNNKEVWKAAALLVDDGHDGATFAHLLVWAQKVHRQFRSYDAEHEILTSSSRYPISGAERTDEQTILADAFTRFVEAVTLVLRKHSIPVEGRSSQLAQVIHALVPQGEGITQTREDIRIARKRRKRVGALSPP